MITTKNGLLNDIQQNANHWRYVDLRKKAKKLNQVITDPEVQQAYEDATKYFWQLKRWDIFKHFRDRLPKDIKALEGEDYIFPMQIESCDWDWNMGPGRKPKYLKYVLSHACHWMSAPNLVLAQKLMPRTNWITISSDLHTSVLSLEDQLLFDPYYFACEVSTLDALQMLFGETYNDENDYQIYADDDPYDPLEGSAGHAIELWNVIDSSSRTKEELVKILSEFIDQHEAETMNSGGDPLTVEAPIEELEQVLPEMQLLTLRTGWPNTPSQHKNPYVTV